MFCNIVVSIFQNSFSNSVEIENALWTEHRTCWSAYVTETIWTIFSKMSHVQLFFVPLLVWLCLLVGWYFKFLWQFAYGYHTLTDSGPLSTLRTNRHKKQCCRERLLRMTSMSLSIKFCQAQIEINALVNITIWNR